MSTTSEKQVSFEEKIITHPLLTYTEPVVLELGTLENLTGSGGAGAEDGASMMS